MKKSIIVVTSVKFNKNVVELMMSDQALNTTIKSITISRPAGDDKVDFGIAECIRAFIPTLKYEYKGFINETSYTFSKGVNAKFGVLINQDEEPNGVMERV